MSNEENEKKLGEALKKGEFKITVDDTAMKQMAETNAELKQKVKELEQKEGESFDLEAKRKELAKDFNDKRFLEAENKQELAQMVAEAVKEAQEIKQGKPTGSAPMNDRQLGVSQGSDIMTQKFNSTKDMIAELRRREKSVNAQTSQEAKKILEALYRKSLEAQKQSGQAIPLFDPNNPENLPELKEEHGFKTPIDPTTGDLGEFKKGRKQKLVEQGRVE